MTDLQAKHATLTGLKAFEPYVDFKGWRFRAPFRCLCCGIEVDIRQFCYGRACPSCDCGHCHHSRYDLLWSGPREIIDRNDRYFIKESYWMNPPNGSVEFDAITRYQRMREMTR